MVCYRQKVVIPGRGLLNAGAFRPRVRNDWGTVSNRRMIGDGPILCAYGDNALNGSLSIAVRG
jgi:hypothetical protein